MVVVMATLVGCGDGSDVTGGEFGAVVFGRVTRNTGAAVGGTAISVRVFRAGCSGTVRTSGSGAAAADGAFRVELHTNVTTPLCGELEAVPPPASGLGRTVVESFFVRFASPPDSVRVDVALTPS
jgi:hypothetical protein